MPQCLPTEYGIELKLLLPSDGDWEGIYTYYNHGLEPPLGGVRSDAVDEAAWTVEQVERLLSSTAIWVRYVIEITKNPKDHNPDLPLEYSLKPEDNGDLLLAVKMETLESTIRWDKVAGKIIFSARDAFDLSWEGFLYYKIILEDFVAKIKEQ